MTSYESIDLAVKLGGLIFLMLIARYLCCIANILNQDLINRRLGLHG